MSMTAEFDTLIRRARTGDRHARQALFEAVYDTLRTIAKNQMRRERPGATLQPTDLVHETFLKLSRDKEQRWEHLGHFIGAASRAMREILIDRARKRQATKHGGKRRRVSLDNCEKAQAEENWNELLWLDQSLEALSRHDAALAELVEMKYFLNLPISTIAQAQGVHARTINNRWKFARTWLRKDILERVALD
jgi:RNA polymerase sigma factor (TIGR02999 family)